MTKEIKNKNVLVRLNPSLYEKFKAKCDSEYKTMSVAIRQFILEYSKDVKS
jgi:hypothetical protein